MMNYFPLAAVNQLLQKEVIHELLTSGRKSVYNSDQRKALPLVPSDSVGLTAVLVKLCRANVTEERAVMVAEDKVLQTCKLTELPPVTGHM
jgi:hypothetical protein